MSVTVTNPMPDVFWAREALSHLIETMSRKDVSYDDLAERLVARGTMITGFQLEAEVMRLEMTVGLYFQCLHALGETRVEMAQVDPGAQLDTSLS